MQTESARRAWECAGLTALSTRHRLPFDIEQVLDAGKAVRIGHGPAAVIGKTP